jgi:hypothetical protein
MKLMSKVDLQYSQGSNVMKKYKPWQYNAGFFVILKPDYESCVEYIVTSAIILRNVRLIWLTFCF